MSNAAVIVEGLSKSYRIGQRERHGKTFREAVTDSLASPFRAMGARFAQREGAAEDELFWALRDVSFEIKRGEVVGIIGRNGAGKSTLLKILSRITEPTSGTVRLRGRVASLLEVGTGFHGELTGRENIFLNGAILGMKHAEIARKFDEIVAFAEVDKFLDTPVKRYSSGMYVRLAFAVAAHLEPEILIVDEVLAVGDATFQRKCLGKIRDVARGEGRTVLFVSHNMAAVTSLCSRACMFAKGTLLGMTAVDEAIQIYMGGLEDRGSARVNFQRPPRAPQWMTQASLIVNGKPSTKMYIGDLLTLHVDFQSEQPLRNPRLGFALCAADGTRLINSNNRFQQAHSYPDPVAQGTFACDIGQVPLVAGRYTISLGLGDSAVDSHVEERAISFEVLERDIWGFGKCPPPSASHLWWPAKFELRQKDEAMV